MTAFIVGAIALLAVALVLVLRPLLHGGGGSRERARKLAALLSARDAGVIDAAEYDAKHAQLLAEAPAAAAPPASRALALSLAAIVPALAFALYWLVGEPRALDPVNLQRSADTTSPETSAPEMESAIAGLAARLQQSPEDLEGWLLLGRAYKATGRFAEAQATLERAFAIAPDNLDVMTEYAEALAMNTPNRDLSGRPTELLQQALARDPTHQRALWLAGAAAAQQQRYPEAVQHWEALLTQMPPDADVAATLREQIARARERGGMAPMPGAVAGGASAENAPAAVASNDAAATTNDPASPTSTGPSLTVIVDIAPALKAQVAPTDILFVFARLPEGPRMPLAIQRLPASALPATVVLDDSMGMLPSLKLSSSPQVIVGARVSKSGNAAPQPGDLQVLSAPLAVQAQREPLRLVISDVLK